MLYTLSIFRTTFLAILQRILQRIFSGILQRRNNFSLQLFFTVPGSPAFYKRAILLSTVSDLFLPSSALFLPSAKAL